MSEEPSKVIMNRRHGQRALQEIEHQYMVKEDKYNNKFTCNPLEIASASAFVGSILEL